jgi:hypothetical protein
VLHKGTALFLMIIAGVAQGQVKEIVVGQYSTYGVGPFQTTPWPEVFWGSENEIHEWSHYPGLPAPQFKGSAVEIATLPGDGDESNNIPSRTRGAMMNLATFQIFVPVSNLTDDKEYFLTAEVEYDCVQRFKPRVLYPFTGTLTDELQDDSCEITAFVRCNGESWIWPGSGFEFSPPSPYKVENGVAQVWTTMGHRSGTFSFSTANKRFKASQCQSWSGPVYQGKELPNHMELVFKGKVRGDGKNPRINSLLIKSAKIGIFESF